MAGPPQASHAATSALPAGAGAEDFAATALDRPAFDISAASAGSWEPSAPVPPAGPPAAAAGRPPRPARQGAPVPQSDLGLKVALGALIALIVLLVIAIVAGLVVTMSGEGREADAVEQGE